MAMNNDDHFNDELARRRDKSAAREERMAEIADDLSRLTPQQLCKVSEFLDTLLVAERLREKSRVN